MRRAPIAIACLAASLALAPAGASAAPGAYQQVLQTYEQAGSIPPCAFTGAQLQAALGGVDAYGAQYFADFTQAVQTALSSRAGGACATAPVLGNRRPGPAGAGRVPPPPSLALTAATSASVPWPLAALGAAAILAGLAAAAAATLNRRRPPARRG